jgi:hypothetical protein
VVRDAPGLAALFMALCGAVGIDPQHSTAQAGPELIDGLCPGSLKNLILHGGSLLVGSGSVASTTAQALLRSISPRRGGNRPATLFL